MATPNIAIQRWMLYASPEQARQFAKAARTSVAHLRHVAAGRRGISAEFAQRLAHASVKFPLPLHLLQQELCAACAKCPLIPDIEA